MKKEIYKKARGFFFTRKIKDVANYLANTYATERKIDKKYSTLILAPHQDDESIGCGGTVKLISNIGGNVDVVYIANGEAGTRKGVALTDEEKKRLVEIRNSEARKACDILGVKGMYLLNGRDTQLHHEMNLYKKLLEILTQNKYDIVFCPWKYDGHSDHIATFKILKKALRHYPENIEIWLYEIWTPLIPNCMVNISTTIEDKINAIKAHRSQIECIQYHQKLLGLAQYRSIHVPGAEFAEAFLCGNKEFILSL